MSFPAQIHTDSEDDDYEPPLTFHRSKSTCSKPTRSSSTRPTKASKSTHPQSAMPPPPASLDPRPTRTPAPPQPLHPDVRYQRWFSSPGQIEIFEKEKFATRPVVKGISMDWNWFASENFSFIELLEYQGLKPLLTLSEPSYEDLVRVFYSNLSYNPTSKVIKSSVKKQEIRMRADDWTTITGLDWEGFLFEPDKDNHTHMNFSLKESIKLLCHTHATIDVDQPYCKPDYASGNLTTQARALQFVVNKVLAPRSANFAKMSYDDHIIMWAILTRQSVNWSHYILTRMISCRKLNRKTGAGLPLPYTMLITKILKHFDIDLSGELPAATSTLGESVLTQAKFAKENGVWITKGKAEFCNKSIKDFGRYIPTADQPEGVVGIPPTEWQTQMSSDMEFMKAQIAQLTLNQTTMQSTLDAHTGVLTTISDNQAQIMRTQGELMASFRLFQNWFQNVDPGTPFPQPDSQPHPPPPPPPPAHVPTSSASGGPSTGPSGSAFRIPTPGTAEFADFDYDVDTVLQFASPDGGTHQDAHHHD